MSVKVNKYQKMFLQINHAQWNRLTSDETVMACMLKTVVVEGLLCRSGIT